MRAAAPQSASRGSARAGAPTIASPSASSPGTSLAECTARSTSPSSSAASIVSTQRRLSAPSPRSPPVRSTTVSTGAVDAPGDELRLAQRERAAARPEPQRRPPPRGCRCVASRASRTVRALRRTPRLGRVVVAAQREEVAQQLDLAVAALGVEALAGGSSARAAGAPSTARASASMRARSRLRRRLPAARVLLEHAARRSRRRAARSAAIVGRTSSWPSQRAKRCDLLLDDRLGRRHVGGAAREVAARRPPRGRRCRAASRPRARAQRGSMSRGTAMSISSSGRPPRAAITSSSSSRADDRRAARRSRRARCRPRSSVSGSALEADDLAAEALRDRSRAVGVAVGDEDRATPRAASACAVSSLVSPAPMITTGRPPQVAEQLLGEARPRPTRG